MNRGIAAAMTAALGLVLVAGCDNGPSAVQTRDRSAGDVPLAAAVLTDAAPVETIEATPAVRTVVTANRRETVDAKVTRLFERNGAAFGARTAEDYMAKVQAFARNPPRDADTAKRPNGDTLYYQASTNTFAVVARDGTPRTMFKPDKGAQYWAEQKSRAPTFGQRRSKAGE